MRLNRLDSEMAQEMLYLLFEKFRPTMQLLKWRFYPAGLMELTKKT
jgi:hypothetical protein